MFDWFATGITKPLKNDRCTLTEEDVTPYITTSATLTPQQRFEIYNQQYWWRLINVMRSNFPYVAALTGDCFVEDYVFPYFLDHPIEHWAIDFCAPHFAKWIDDPKISEAAQIDWDYNKAFFDTSHLPLKHFNKKITLQPHIALYHFSEHRFFERDKLVHKKEVDIPETGDYYFILYRTPDFQIYWKPLEKEAYFALKTFQMGATLDEACEHLENVHETTVSTWFNTWAREEWLVEYL